MTNTNKKLTKSQKNCAIISMLNLLGDCLCNDEIAATGKVPYGVTIEDAIAHLTHENELLAKKNSGDNKKPTKVQAENEAHKAAIVEYLTTTGGNSTATQVMTACNLSSNQKAAALLKSLVDSGKVNKSIIKGKALFSVA